MTKITISIDNTTNNNDDKKERKVPKPLATPPKTSTAGTASTTYEVKDVKVPKFVMETLAKNEKELVKIINEMAVDTGSASNLTELYVGLASVAPFFELVKSALRDSPNEDDRPTKEEFTVIVTGIGTAYFLGTGEWDEDGHFLPYIPSVKELGSFKTIQYTNGVTADMDKTLTRIARLLDKIGEIAYYEVYAPKKRRTPFSNARYEKADLGALFSTLASTLMTLKTLKSKSSKS